MEERCPCCLRPFESMRDFPEVLVKGVDILPVPEAIDSWSEEAYRAHLDQPSQEQRAFPTGINRTPDIAATYWSQAIQKYLAGLKALEGQELSPHRLAPPFEEDRYFRWAYLIPDSRLYASLSEKGDGRAMGICEVVIHGQGPNLGSAGGPTLQRFGAIAAIHYEGRLAASSP